MGDSASPTAGHTPADIIRRTYAARLQYIRRDYVVLERPRAQSAWVALRISAFSCTSFAFCLPRHPAVASRSLQDSRLEHTHNLIITVGESVSLLLRTYVCLSKCGRSFVEVRSIRYPFVKYGMVPYALEPT